MVSNELNKNCIDIKQNIKKHFLPLAENHFKLPLHPEVYIRMFSLDLQHKTYNIHTLQILLVKLFAHGTVVFTWRSSCNNAWWLHAQALVLLMLPQKSTKSSDLSVSE